MCNTIWGGDEWGEVGRRRLAVGIITEVNDDGGLCRLARDVFKDTSRGAWEEIGGRGFGGWWGVLVCLRGGHGGWCPGVPTGYGPGRRIDWDHIMSDVRHLHILERVEVPAFPIHLVI